MRNATAPECGSLIEVLHLYPQVHQTPERVVVDP